ncbi:MAG: ThiF family adenylyltransferase [Solirubrobacteraceae bacterium]
MSRQLIARSDDLRRLQEEGYELEIRDGFVLIEHVPYVNAEAKVKYGTLVSTLTLAGDVTTTPDTHVTTFAGDAPCDQHGHVLSKVLIQSGRQRLAEWLEIDHMFSSKPREGYANYYDKLVAYVNILSGPAQALDPEASAQTFRVIDSADPDSVFEYEETASSRAGIVSATAKLKINKLAIVGLGGTGSYILDLVAKTPVREIHLFDGDTFLQHNAFRAPGAASIADLRGLPAKVDYFQQRYAQMRRGIIAHAQLVDESNVDLLRDMDFVFLSLDDGPARKLLVERLEAWGTSFIDVGMGLYEADGAIAGLVRTTASTAQRRDHVWDKHRLPFGAPDPGNDYVQNIQVADLNALNATLAVIKWKKLMGFYIDLEGEHFSVYEVDGNSIVNDDKA